MATTIKSETADVVIGGGATGTAVVSFLKKSGQRVIWIKASPNSRRNAFKVDTQSQKNHAPISDAVPDAQSGNLPNWGGRSLNSMVAKSALPKVTRHYISVGESKTDINGGLGVETWRHRLDFKDEFDTTGVEIIEGWIQLIDEKGKLKTIEILDSADSVEVLETSGNLYVCAGGVGSAVILRKLLDKNSEDLDGVRYSGHVSASLSGNCIDHVKVNRTVRQSYSTSSIESPIVFEKVINGDTYIYAALRASINDKNAMALAARKILETRLGQYLLPSKILKKSLGELPLLPWIEILRLFDTRLIHQASNLAFQRIVLRRSILLPPKSFRRGEDLSVHIQYNMDANGEGVITFDEEGVANIQLPVPEIPCHVFEVINTELRDALRSIGVEVKSYRYKELNSLFAQSVDGYHQFSTMYGLDWSRLVEQNGALNSNSGVFFFNSGIFKLGVVPYPTTMTVCFAIGVLDEILANR